MDGAAGRCGLLGRLGVCGSFGSLRVSALGCLSQMPQEVGSLGGIFPLPPGHGCRQASSKVPSEPVVTRQGRGCPTAPLCTAAGLLPVATCLPRPCKVSSLPRCGLRVPPSLSCKDEAALAAPYWPRAGLQPACGFLALLGSGPGYYPPRTLHLPAETMVDGGRSRGPSRSPYARRGQRPCSLPPAPSRSSS